LGFPEPVVENSVMPIRIFFMLLVENGFTPLQDEGALELGNGTEKR
jgi:hypothetical protein